MIRKILQFLCGEEKNGRVNRTVFWTMFSTYATIISTIATVILLWVAYHQLKDVNETTSADFSHKIKNDLFTPENDKLMKLFADSILVFKNDSIHGVWFELDTNEYLKQPYNVKPINIPLVYNALDIDLLLQNFEDLSFYEKKQINIDYIYDQYAYYIEMLWENPDIQAYIAWQRTQPHYSGTYSNFENVYNQVKLKSNKE